MRAAAGLAPFSFSDTPLLVGSRIRADQIRELRAALDSARTALGLSPISYTDPVLTEHVTLARASHVLDLRIGTQ